MTHFSNPLPVTELLYWETMIILTLTKTVLIQAVVVLEQWILSSIDGLVIGYSNLPSDFESVQRQSVGEPFSDWGQITKNRLISESTDFFMISRTLTKTVPIRATTVPEQWTLYLINRLVIGYLNLPSVRESIERHSIGEPFSDCCQIAQNCQLTDCTNL